MSSPLCNFAILCISGIHFFLNPSLSPRRRLDWDRQNADGTLLPLGYSAEDFRRPRRLFHVRLDEASVVLAFGYSRADEGMGVPGPEPVPQNDGFLRLWLATFAARAGFQIFLESVELSGIRLYLNTAHFAHFRNSRITV
jgi:hypothetical protein